MLSGELDRYSERLTALRTAAETVHRVLEAPLRLAGDPGQLIADLGDHDVVGHERPFDEGQAPPVIRDTEADLVAESLVEHERRFVPQLLGQAPLDADLWLAHVMLPSLTVPVGAA